MHVIIDAGHGPNTAGKRTPSYMLERYPQMPEVVEFFANCNIAETLAKRITASSCFAHRLWSTSNDRSIALRVQYANEIADRYGKDKCILVSIHHNAFGNEHQSPTVMGAEVHIAKNASERSERLALSIAKIAQKAGVLLRPYPIVRSNFAILTKTKMPAVLVECGYMTSYWDAWRIQTEYWRHVWAEILYSAIINTALLGTTP